MKNGLDKELSTPVLGEQRIVGRHSSLHSTATSYPPHRPLPTPSQTPSLPELSTKMDGLRLGKREPIDGLHSSRKHIRTQTTLPLPLDRLGAEYVPHHPFTHLTFALQTRSQWRLMRR